MKEPDITRRYHDTWNGRDADALVGCFTKDGTFCNPDTYPGIGGEELANFVKDYGQPCRTFLSNC
jgi:hypothetical protein